VIAGRRVQEDFCLQYATCVMSDIGDSHHPLPWQALTYDANQGGYVVNIDRSRLEGAPAYTSSDTATWDDPSYGRRINDYYGV
jgi:hypothetical protein